MDFHNKFVDTFQDLSKVKNPAEKLLGAFKRKNVWGNMILWHWPCFIWKFFMILFHKMLKFIFQKPPSYPRNICTEHWRKLPNLTALSEIFLYLKNNDSVEHLLKVSLIVLFITYFPGKVKFSHCIWLILLFWIFNLI